MEIIKKVKEAFEKIEGSSIQNVIAGGANGSFVILDIGFDDYSLFIYSSWRISLNKRVIATSNDNNDALVGKLTQQIWALMGDKIVKIELGELVDLKIQLESGKLIDVFSDLQTEDTEEENWCLALKKEDVCYCGINNSQFVVTKYY